MAIVVGSVAVEVVPSAAGFRRALEAQLRDLEIEIDVDANTAGAIGKVEGVKEALDDIGDIDIDIDTDIDIAAALAELEALRLLMEEETPEIDIPVHVDRDGSGLRAAGVLTGRIRAIITTVLTLGPALIPLAASITAVFGALLVPIAAATAGIGAFAIFAVPAITKVVKASKELEKAQQAVDDALTSKTRETALKKQAQLLASLDAPTRAAVVSLNNLKNTFKAFQKQLQPAIFDVFNAGLNVANAALPLLAQLAKVTAPILTELGNKFAGVLRSPEMKRFVAFLSAQAGPAIRSFATILGNLAEGFGKLLIAFAPLTPRVMAGVERLSEGFANLAESEGFRKFLDYAIASLPIVNAFLGTLVKTVGSLLIAFAPFGDLVLKTLTVLLEGFRQMADFAPELTVALVLMLAVILLLTGPLELIAISAIILGAAFKYLYDRSSAVRQVVAEVGDIFERLADRSLPKIREAFEVAMVGVDAAISMVSEAIENNRPQVEQLLVAFEQIGAFLVDYFIPAIGYGVAAAFIIFGASMASVIEILSLVVQVVDNTVSAFQALPDQVEAANGIITASVSAFFGILTGLFMTNIDIIRGVWNSFWGSEFGTLISTNLQAAVALAQLMLALMQATFETAMMTIQFVVQGAFTGITTVVQVSMNATQIAVEVAWAIIQGVVAAAVSAVLANLGPLIAVVQLVAGPFQQANVGVSGSIGELIGMVSDIPGRIIGAIGDLGSLLYGAGLDLISGLIRGITDSTGGLIGVLNNVTDLIGEHKGPPAKDKVLLTPHGRLIMQGLIAGIEAEEPDLIDKLNGLTNRIGRTSATANLGVAGGAGVASGPSYTINARTVDLNERTLGERLYQIDLRERVNRPR